MKNLYKALANFQQEVPTIHKGTAGYGYSYADLTAIYKVINPLMKKHGLGFTQPIVNNQMKTIVFHIESGESIEVFGFAEMGEHKGMSSEQTTGTASSYARKYALNGLFLIDETESDPDTKAPTPKKKETISDDRLAAALTKIKDGSYTMEKLKEKFELTPKQLELC